MELLDLVGIATDGDTHIFDLNTLGLRIDEMSQDLRRFPQDLVDPVRLARLVRAFCWYALSQTLFARGGKHAHHCVLSLVADLATCGRYDWGSAGLAMCYHAMSQVSRVDSRREGEVTIMSGYAHAWQVFSKPSHIFHFAHTHFICCDSH